MLLVTRFKSEEYSYLFFSPIFQISPSTFILLNGKKNVYINLEKKLGFEGLNFDHECRARYN